MEVEQCSSRVLPFKPDFIAQDLAFCKKLARDDMVQCLACENKCRLKPGEWGDCRTRYNDRGVLKSLNFGRCFTPHLDPVEKKPLYHFFPGTQILSVGTAGCNAHCEWCQNSNTTQIEDLDIAVQAMQPVTPEQLLARARKLGVDALSFTYNEPTIYAEFALDAFKLFKQHGMRTVFVSNGYSSKEVVAALSPVMDANNVDLKSFREGNYVKYCGLHLAPIKRNIKDLHEKGVWVEITTLVIPGFNDNDEELQEMAQWIASVDNSIPWHISRFRPSNRMMDRPSTPPETLLKAYRIGKAAGLKFVYVGNIHGGILKGTSHTYCPSCNTTLIKRKRWGDVQFLWKTPGECHNCGTKIEGRWA